MFSVGEWLAGARQPHSLFNFFPALFLLRPEPSYCAHENPDVPHDALPALPKSDIFFSTFSPLQDGQGGFFFSLTGTSSS
jgi:hypothetical protein